MSGNVQLYPPPGSAAFARPPAPLEFGIAFVSEAFRCTLHTQLTHTTPNPPTSKLTNGPPVSTPSRPASVHA